MRSVLILMALACVAGCTTPAPSPAPVTKMSAEEARQMCLSRMHVARSRGAVHWQIYDHCLKENL